MLPGWQEGGHGQYAERPRPDVDDDRTNGRFAAQPRDSPEKTAGKWKSNRRTDGARDRLGMFDGNLVADRASARNGADVVHTGAEATRGPDCADDGGELRGAVGRNDD